MVVPAVKERILEDLGRLSPRQQERAAQLVHEMVSDLPAGTAGRELLRFSGVLDDTSAQEIQSVIEEGCEQVDPDGW